MKAYRIPWTKAFPTHVLNEYSDAELQETLKVANSTDAALLGDSERVGKMKYKELQVHGQVTWKDHVERLVAHQDFRCQISWEVLGSTRLLTNKYISPLHETTVVFKM